MWEYDTRLDGAEVEFHGDALVTEDLVVTGSDHRQQDGVGHVYAFGREDGQLRWKYTIPHGVATNVVAAGARAFAVTLDDELVCLDLSTGRALWTHATGFYNPEFLFNSTPAVDKDRVFFGGLDGTVYALNGVSGEIIWKRQLRSGVSTSVLLVDQALLLGTTDGRFYRLDRTTGDPTAELQMERMPTGRLTAAKDCILGFLGPQTLGCVEPSLRRIRWTRQFPKEWSSARPYLWGDAVLVASEAELSAFRLPDGRPAWSQMLEGTIRGIGSSGDVLYIGTLNGAVYAIRPPARPPG